MSAAYVPSLRKPGAEIVGIKRYPNQDEKKLLIEKAREYQKAWEEDPGDMMACCLPIGGRPAPVVVIYCLSRYCHRKLRRALQGKRLDCATRSMKKLAIALNKVFRRDFDLNEGEAQEAEQLLLDSLFVISRFEAECQLGSFCEWYIPELKLHCTTDDLP